MPNTLAHIGVQSIITRILIPKAELHLIYLGCIIPDLPWILQRVLTNTVPEIGLYELRLYAVNQASLALCLILCLSLSLPLLRFGRAFSILAIGSLLHLLLDACQLKLANGVSLLIPINWKLTRFDWFLPESLATYSLTLFGLFYFLIRTRKELPKTQAISRNFRRWMGAIAFLVLYIFLPAIWIDEAERANNHFVQTLREASNRVGQEIELDRVQYREHMDGATLETFANERLKVKSIDAPSNSVLSIQGKFESMDTINLESYHVHYTNHRDFASYTGLALVLAVLISIVFRSIRNSQNAEATNDR